MCVRRDIIQSTISVPCVCQHYRRMHILCFTFSYHAQSAHVKGLISHRFGLTSTQSRRNSRGCATAQGLQLPGSPPTIKKKKKKKTFSRKQIKIKLKKTNIKIKKIYANRRINNRRDNFCYCVEQFTKSNEILHE